MLTRLLAFVGWVTVAYVHSSVVSVSSLNRECELGLLYDADSDSIIPISALRGSLPIHSTILVPKTKTVSEFRIVKTAEDKLKSIGLSVQAQLSILTGAVTASGAISVATHESSSTESIQAVLTYRTSIMYEILNVRLPSVQDLIDVRPLQRYTKGTHVVIGIEFGAQINCNIEADTQGKRSSSQVASELSAAYNSIATSVQGKIGLNVADQTSTRKSNLKISCFSDINLPYQPTSVEQAFSLISEMPRLLAESNSGKGVAQRFEAIEIESLKNIILMDQDDEMELYKVIKNNTYDYNYNVSYIETSVLQLFYEHSETKMFVLRFQSSVLENESAFNETVLNSIKRLYFDFETTFDLQKVELREILMLAKQGSVKPATLLLIQKASEIKEHPHGPIQVRKTIETAFRFCKSRINYNRIFLQHGISYLKLDSTTDEVLVENRGKDLLFLFYKEQWKINNRSGWIQITDYFLNINVTRFVVDCDNQYHDEQSCSQESPHLFGNTFFLLRFNKTGKYSFSSHKVNNVLKWTWGIGSFLK